MLLVAACDVRGTERPTVNYLSVDARPSKAHVGGTSLTVEIEVEATSAMPHVAPHVIVGARCADESDDRKAFFMTLSNAHAGDRKIDSVELFELGEFEVAPERCDITLTLSEGATQPQRYCYERGTTRAGRCT